MGFAAAPLSWMYGGVLNIRHFLYDIGFYKSFAHERVFVICVGNLNLGGTGKTPTSESLIKKLSAQYTVGVLSRGYGRSTKGFLIVDHNGDPNKYGDEPVQMAQKNSNIPFAVCENRWVGVNKFLEYRPDLQVIILDDAFQHRRLKADLNILLTPFNKPFFRDSLVPSGGLRDLKRAAVRADMLLITKSPKHVSHETKKVYQRESGFTLEKTLFFAHLNYAALKNPLTGEEVQPKHIDQALLITGIANPKPISDFLSASISNLKAVNFRDHYRYSAKDIKSIQQIFNNFAKTPDRIIITTEKDYVKLVQLQEHWPNDWTVLVAPIQMEINDNLGDRFIKKLSESVNQKLGKND